MGSGSEQGDRVDAERCRSLRQLLEHLNVAFTLIEHRRCALEAIAKDGCVRGRGPEGEAWREVAWQLRRGGIESERRDAGICQCGGFDSLRRCMYARAETVLRRTYRARRLRSRFACTWPP